MGRAIHVGNGPDTFAKFDLTDVAAEKLINDGVFYVCGDEPGGHDLHIDPMWIAAGKLEILLLGIAAATNDPASEHKGLPVAGYKPTQSQEAVDLVNEGKLLEERVLRYIEKIASSNSARGDSLGGHSGRYLNIGKTDIEKGFMMVYRSVFQPNGSRIRLPENPVDMDF